MMKGQKYLKGIESGAQAIHNQSNTDSTLKGAMNLPIKSLRSPFGEEDYSSNSKDTFINSFKGQTMDHDSL